MDSTVKVHVSMLAEITVLKFEPTHPDDAADRQPSEVRGSATVDPLLHQFDWNRTRCSAHEPELCAEHATIARKRAEF